MPDPRFFPTAGVQRLVDIAAVAEARFEGDGERLFTGVAPLQTAGPDDVSFLDNRRYADALSESKAGAVVLHPAMAERLPVGCVGLLAAQPNLAFARIALLFHPDPVARAVVHPTAVIAPDAVIGQGVEIGALAVSGARAEIGAGCIIHSHAVVGDGVVLGAGCRIHPHASISHAIAGAGVVLHPGARVGAEGYGFATTAAGEHVTMPQLGRVILGDGVQVGANSTVDRGSHGDTVLGPGTRLDNLVQIGHNVHTGRGCVIVAHAGISGSSVLGDYVVLAAQAGIAGHLTIGSKVRIGAQAGVMNDVPAGTDVIGSPAWPVREFWRSIAYLRKIAQGGRAGAEARDRKADREP